MAEAPDALDPISALREHHRTAQRAQAVNHAKAPERGANGWVFVGKCSGNQGKSQGKTFFFLHVSWKHPWFPVQNLP